MKKVFPILLAVLITGVGGFFAGLKYQQTKSPFGGNFSNREIGNRTPPANFQTRSGANMVRGEIVSQDETGLTVKLANEGSKIIVITNDTEINRTTEGSIEDLTPGTQVMVFGSADSEGLITAQSIQINPDFANQPLMNPTE